MIWNYREINYYHPWYKHLNSCRSTRCCRALLYHWTITRHGRLCCLRVCLNVSPLPRSIHLIRIKCMAVTPEFSRASSWAVCPPNKTLRREATSTSSLYHTLCFNNPSRARLTISKSILRVTCATQRHLISHRWCLLPRTLYQQAMSSLYPPACTQLQKLPWTHQTLLCKAVLPVLTLSIIQISHLPRVNQGYNQLRHLRHLCSWTRKCWA